MSETYFHRHYNINVLNEIKNYIRIIDVYTRITTMTAKLHRKLDIIIIYFIRYRIPESRSRHRGTLTGREFAELYRGIIILLFNFSDHNFNLFYVYVYKSQ